MTGNATKAKWSGGLAEWLDGDTAFLSVAFTWRLNDAFSRAVWYRQAGYQVRAGGPALFLVKMQHRLAEVANLGGDAPDAVARHNPMATFASRGCPVGCHFCIVPAMEGRAFTLLPDFTPRPILCDNNLSALPPEYQRHIIQRYQAANIKLLDANSGFEPQTFDEEVFHRWKPILKGPWRFASDETAERDNVRRVMAMLKRFNVPQHRIRPYVMIGHEPFADCMERIHEVIALGGEPHVQPFMKLNALEKRPHVRHDWTERLLIDVARWANGRYWKYTPFSGYRRSVRPVALENGQHCLPFGGEVRS